MVHGRVVDVIDDMTARYLPVDDNTQFKIYSKSFAASPVHEVYFTQPNCQGIGYYRLPNTLMFHENLNNGKFYKSSSSAAEGLNFQSTFYRTSCRMNNNSGWGYGMSTYSDTTCGSSVCKFVEE
jgi:hypothetical protein